MAKIELQPDFKDFLTLLSSHGVLIRQVIIYSFDRV